MTTRKNYSVSPPDVHPPFVPTNSAQSLPFLDRGKPLLSRSGGCHAHLLLSVAPDAAEAPGGPSAALAKLPGFQPMGIPALLPFLLELHLHGVDGTPALLLPRGRHWCLWSLGRIEQPANRLKVALEFGGRLPPCRQQGFLAV